jgi:hypothetical protein
MVIEIIDPGLNDNLDAIDASELIKELLDDGLDDKERLILITLAGIGARVDRLIEMVKALEKKFN